MRRLVHIIPAVLLPLLLISCPMTAITMRMMKAKSHLNIEEIAARKPLQVDISEYEEKYGEYNGVYLSIEESVEHSGNKDPGLMTGLGLPEGWNYNYIYKEKALVLNPECDQLTTLNLFAEPEKLFIRITSPDGQSAVYGKANLIEDKTENSRIKYKFAYPNITKGSIVELAYENAFKVYPVNFAYVVQYNSLLQRAIPCERRLLTYTYPAWWEIEVKWLGKERELNYETVVDTDKKQKKLVYSAIDLAPIVDEPYSPFFMEIAETADIMITDLLMVGGSFRHPQSWQSYAVFFADYVQGNDNKLFKLPGKIVDSLAISDLSELEKLKAIVKYIYDNIRIGESQNANFNHILKNREGSIFDITALTSVMLSAAGVTSSFMLVHDARDGYFDENYFSGDQLYTPALRVIVGNDDHIVFPYINNLPVDHIPEPYLGQRALLIPPRNPEAAWIWNLPEKNLASNTMDEYYDLNVDTAGIIDVVERRVIRGSVAYWFRKMLEEQPEKETKDSLQALLTYTDGDVDLESYSITNLDDYDLPLEIELNYTIDNLVMVTPEEVIFQTGGLFSPLSNQKIKFDADKRINPIKIYYDEGYNKHIAIRFPESWRLTTELNQVHVENQFGTIDGNYNIENGSIHAEQFLMLNKTMAPKTAVSDLITLSGSSSLLNIPTLVFQVEEYSGSF